MPASTWFTIRRSLRVVGLVLLGAILVEVLLRGGDLWHGWTVGMLFVVYALAFGAQWANARGRAVERGEGGAPEEPASPQL